MHHTSPLVFLAFNYFCICGYAGFLTRFSVALYYFAGYMQLQTQIDRSINERWPAISGVKYQAGYSSNDTERPALISTGLITSQDTLAMPVFSIT
jgi:hypothetical protein